MNVCSDCGCDLHTYYQSGLLMGECHNPECRLFYVTLTVEALDKLTTQERVEWGKITETHREAEKRYAAESEQRMGRIPERLRRLG